MSKRADQAYIDFDPYADECEVKCRTIKMVTTRAPHSCMGVPGEGQIHEIPAGTRTRFEKALVDGEWGSYYTCVTCIDRYMDAYPKRCFEVAS